ncbi:MAG TPA: TonB-dependent receptor [Sphingomonas sp.]
MPRLMFGLYRPLPIVMGLAACAASGATSAAAQSVTDAARTDIVITATPLHDGDDAAPAPPAQTITAVDLRRSHALDLSDQLKRSAGGVFVNEVQVNPLQPDVSYRGFTASPLLGTPQGLSVYSDGVRLNQPFGDIVSWDLIPKAAIASTTLVPGSNPLFGRNSLGGAIAIATRDGARDPGVELAASAGSFRRRTAEATIGARLGGGFDLFVAGNYFSERGWRAVSPSKAGQGFAKIRWAGARTTIALSGSYARSDLNGNGLQEMRLLAAERRSIYTQPDTTRNEAWLGNLTVEHRFSDSLSFSGNVFERRIDTDTFNGDINGDALGENLYQPNASERAALAAAGYTGFPLAGETQANTPFPKWRCIADILLDSEPNEKCNGLVNRGRVRQREWGATGELTFVFPVGRGSDRLTFGLSYVRSIADFAQSSRFGYLTPQHDVVTVDGPGAFADGTQDSENAFDARVDLDARTSTFSAYGLDSLTLGKVTIDLSARYDRTAIRNRDRITPGKGPGSLDSDQAFERLNPALSLRWAPTKYLAVDAALAQTSRAPSAVELGCSDPANPCRLPNALAGDPPLKQVIARTIEGGINADIRGITFRLGVFRTVSRDDILFVTDDPSGYGYFRNFGKTRRQGIDVDIAGKFGTVRVTAHYTLLDATYRSAETVDGSGNSGNDGPAPGFGGSIAIARGDRIPLIPRNIFKAAIGWDVTRFLSLDIDMIAVSGMYARGNENNQDQADGVYYLGPGKTQPYAVVNAGAEVRPAADVTLFVQIDNLFDKKYATAAQLGSTGFDTAGNFVSRPFSAPVIDGERPLVSSTFYSPGAPRSVQVGARVKF